ncbi:MAG: TIGR00282 family metallophosphoesterase [Candidatus Hydrogenedentota bacterium]
MRILFIGDIVGRPGRQAVGHWLPELREAYALDIVVANAENIAGGTGATPETLEDLRQRGVEAFTMGNHTWRKRVLISAIEQMHDIVRPANFPEGVPGKGATVITLRDGRRLGLLNLIGRVFMDGNDCPFGRADKELTALRAQTPVVLVDMHAEATSEKVAMAWNLDGRCTAVIGTHTHVPTADERILPGGTAMITDVGMTGPRDSIIGVEREAVITKFKTGMPRTYNVAKGPVWLNGVFIEADDTSGRATRIERVTRADV